MLLLLSAMLSALTGIGSSARVPESAATIAASIERVRVASQAAIVSIARPVQALSTLIEVAGRLMPLAEAAPAGNEPVYARRRRE